MIKWFKLLLSLSMVSMTTGQGRTDLTRVAESQGEDVVKASLALIHESCVFSNDYLFLRRLAYVNSTNGEDANTYRSGFHGGIWQISRQNYELTKNVSSLDYSSLFNALNVTWNETSWEDLRKPLYSGIAAMITLERLAPIPKDLESQAEFYANHLSGDVNEFIFYATALDTDCTRAIDVAFVLDASGSIQPVDYEKSKNFTAEVVKGFTLGDDAVRVAVISFSTYVYEHIGLLDYNNTDDLQSVIIALDKNDGYTNTSLALDKLRTSVFTETAGSRKNAARIAIVQTDGQSQNMSKTIRAASDLKAEGVIVFAIGIGSGVNEEELKGIATPPSCTHVRMLDDFTELNSIIADIKETACKTEIVHETNATSEFRCDVPQTIRIDVDNETSIITYPASGNLNIYGSFFTTQPSAAFADFSTSSKDGKPSIIYVADSDQTLYLSMVSDSINGSECESTFLFETVPSNSLRKTGASNLCIKQLQFEECSDIDYIKSGDYAVNKAPTVCQATTVGYHQHPDNQTKYVYCAAGGMEYIVNCPGGFAYLPSQEDCVAPVDLWDPCAVCTNRNWVIGLRRFPILDNEKNYVNCTGPMSCTLEECSRIYLPDDQVCESEVPIDNSASLMSVFSVAVFGLMSLLYIIML